MKQGCVFNIGLSTLQKLLPDLHFTEADDIDRANQDDPAAVAHRKARRRAGGHFLVQLFQSECFEDFGDGA